MTADEAAAEARRRWGGDAITSTAGPSFFVGGWVVSAKGKRYQKYYGVGFSWELAFEDADAKQASQ